MTENSKTVVDDFQLLFETDQNSGNSKYYYGLGKINGGVIQ